MVQSSVPQIFRISAILCMVLCILASSRLQAEEARDTYESEGSALVFRFFPGRMMFYDCEANRQSIMRADSLISANMDDIVSGDAYVQIKGVCSSYPTEIQNRNAAKNRSNQVKSWFIVYSGMKENYYRTEIFTGADVSLSGLGDEELVTLHVKRAVGQDGRLEPASVPSRAAGNLPSRSSTADDGHGRLHGGEDASSTEKVTVEVGKETAATEEPPVPHVSVKQRKPLAFNIKTNLLYDAVGFPSLEVEIPIGRHFSINAEGAVAWWSSKKCNTFYQLDMLSPEVRWWFGQKSRWHGHYVGAFGMVGLYDLEWRGSRGYQGEYWAAGLSYGYMFPIGRKLSLEAGVGVGFMRTGYEDYLPIDGHYVYQESKRSNYFGPLKAKLAQVRRLDAFTGKGGRR